MTNLSATFDSGISLSGLIESIDTSHTSFEAMTTGSTNVTDITEDILDRQENRLTYIGGGDLRIVLNNLSSRCLIQVTPSTTNSHS